MTTLIRNAEMVIAWDAGTKSHIYIRTRTLPSTAAPLTFVGRGYAGPPTT